MGVGGDGVERPRWSGWSCSRSVGPVLAFWRLPCVGELGISTFRQFDQLYWKTAKRRDGMIVEFDEDWDFENDPPYKSIESLDFSIISSGMKRLPLFCDDIYLGMQAINVGLVDAAITQLEYKLLKEYLETERVPLEPSIMISALSQMWVFGLYEVMRLWKSRFFDFEKWRSSGGIQTKVQNMSKNYSSDECDEMLNITLSIRARQLKKYGEDVEYRESISSVWSLIKPVFEVVELYRMNFAKHAAPGKESSVPRAPGYGRINRWCGSMDYEFIDKERHYHAMNRRDIADLLRMQLEEIQNM